MLRIVFILIKPRKKFLSRIYFILLIFLTFGYFLDFFGDIFERLLIDAEIRFGPNLLKRSLEKQSIQYVYNIFKKDTFTTKSKRFILKSECDCRKWETIMIEQINEESQYSGKFQMLFLKF